GFDDARDQRRDVVGAVDAQDAERLLVVAVDEAVDDDARADAAAAVDGVAQRGDERQDVAFVAHGGDAGGEIGGGPLDLLAVRVHVPQPGHDGGAGDVDAARARGHGGRGARTGGDDAIAVDHNGGVLDRRRARAVDEAGADQRQRPRRGRAPARRFGEP